MLLNDLAKKHRAYKGVEPLTVHYLDVYNKHFKDVRMEQLSILEIGVQGGGSLKMWAEYFPNSIIHGVDTDKKCKRFEDGRIKVFIGDQEDCAFLDTLAEYDIIIDDGGHTMSQQITSFKYLWSRSLYSNGVYIIEDLTTSYWPKFSGGYQKPGTTVNYLKKLIDYLNRDALDHERAGKLRKGLRSISLQSMHFYPMMCFLYKE